LRQIDVLGYSLGGMVAQEMALQRPSLVRKMVLVGTAPEGGDDIMHMEKPELKKIVDDPNLNSFQKLVKLFSRRARQVRRPARLSWQGSPSVSTTRSPFRGQKLPRLRSRLFAPGKQSVASGLSSCAR
jgi:pimeloyl-ACP methyl ester carboxylesterase